MSTDQKTALERYKESGCDAEEPDPIERLRFFCSLAMNGQDWLDVEPFFDALKPLRSPLTNRQKASLYVALGHFRACGSQRCADGILSIMKAER